MSKRTATRQKTPTKAVPLRMARQCGTCTACCFIFDIPELNKPRRKPCQFLKAAPDASGMCTLRESQARRRTLLDGEVKRPELCKTFRCFWLDALIPEDLKPDACGIVFRSNHDGSAVTGFEIREGATDTPRVMEYIQALTDRGVPVYVIQHEEPGVTEEKPRRVFRTPPGVNKEFDKLIGLLETAQEQKPELSEQLDLKGVTPCEA